MIYYNNPETAEEEAATRKRANNGAKTPQNFGLPLSTHRAIMKHWVENRESHPKRQRWINRLRELGFFEPLQI